MGTRDLLFLALICKLAWAGTMESCAHRCGERFNKAADCQCNHQCDQHKDCCEDYEKLCTNKEELQGKEAEWEEAASYSNLYLAPNSCQGRCGETFDKHHPCHCNSKCQEFGNCCEDYENLCAHDGFSQSNDGITNEELLIISEKIYKVDNNKAQKEDIILNSQNRIFPSETNNRVDRCPEPLYSYVNEELFSKPTYAAFINLLNNYQRMTGQGEHFTSQQLREQDIFLQEIMKTAVMKELYGFLHQKNRYSSKQEFVNELKNMWFGLYSRGNDEGDSSGFEHVFSGEVKKGKVTGFHNWIRFYLQEKEGLVDYYSHNYNGPWDSYPDVLGMQFNWDGYYKEVGSAFIGSSPEFEFALYSLCFIGRPGRMCHLSLGGYSLAIQTYTWDKTTYGNGKKYIATAYVVSSTH
ncbi:uridylate-specific endoribonuclease isoform X2 [Antechinus flavipes]|uniref:uridylate-specific endoribonuclease isoform X2 n=2 Tax=Antechinus flavipes TaxID=38775 RepID=UPI002235C3A5|nr:uridylate-specific endoribonuclease isoform X2 [Antechinus flavipes]